MKTLINVGGWQECYGAEWGSEGSERKNGGRRIDVCQGAHVHSGTAISKDGTPVTQYHRETIKDRKDKHAG